MAALIGRLPEQLEVRLWRTAAGRHGPDSPYVIAWLGVLGPTATWAWTVMAKAAVDDGWRVSTADLARTLGVGDGQLYRSLSRMVAFNVARVDVEALWVRAALPDVPERFVGRMSRPARLVHQTMAQRPEEQPPVVPTAGPTRLGVA